MSGEQRLLDLPHGYQAVIDEDDWPLVQGFALYRGVNGYVYFSKWRDGKSHPQTLHTLLLGRHLERHIDHINGDTLDNRRDNLRVATYSQNQVNRKALNRNNRSGIRGVSHRPDLSAKNPWHAQIMVDRRAMYLGVFSTQEHAVEARRSAELRYYGEFCP